MAGLYLITSSVNLDQVPTVLQGSNGIFWGRQCDVFTRWSIILKLCMHRLHVLIYFLSMCIFSLTYSTCGAFSSLHVYRLWSTLIFLLKVHNKLSVKNHVYFNILCHLTSAISISHCCVFSSTGWWGVKHIGICKTLLFNLPPSSREKARIIFLYLQISFSSFCLWTVNEDRTFSV